MSKKTKGTGNVRLFPVAKETKIEPPPEHESRFKARGSRLQMRSGVGEKEKLVSLYDVVAWLVTDCEIPLKPAIRQVVTKVKAIDECDIFYLEENDYAKPCSPDSPWRKYLDDGEVPALSAVQSLEMSAFELSRLVNAPGEKLVFDESKETPFEYFGRTDSVVFALTWHKANGVFGWGRVVAEEMDDKVAPEKAPASAMPKKLREKEQSPEWTGQRLLALRVELQKKGVKDYAAQAAKQARISPRAERRRVEVHKLGGALANVAGQLKAAGTKKGGAL